MRILLYQYPIQSSMIYNQKKKKKFYYLSVITLLMAGAGACLSPADLSPFNHTVSRSISLVTVYSRTNSKSIYQNILFTNNIEYVFSNLERFNKYIFNTYLLTTFNFQH